MSSPTARLAPVIAVAFVAIAPPAARADEFVRVGDGPEREWPSVPLQIRWSLETALLVVEGRLHIANARSKAGEVGNPRDFGTASFAIDRTLKGTTPGSTLEVELPAYSPTEPSWWQSLTDRTSLKELAEQLRNLERELVDGDMGEAAYQDRREELRSRILRSPGYRDADRYLLVRVRISRGLDDPPYRDADVLLEEGGSYVLMAFTPPSRSGGHLRLRERALDIRSTQRFMKAVPPGGPEESGASFGPETDFLLTSVGELELGMSREALMDLRGETLVHDALEPGEVPSLLFEEIESEHGLRRIIYFVSEEKLLQLIHMDTYPLEVLDERIDRKLRAATGKWGRPDSKFAERQLPVGEYLGVVWRTGPETVLTISYVPAAARTESATDGFPVITRYLPGSPADVRIPSIEPESFDLAAESAALDARIGSWEEH